MTLAKASSNTFGAAIQIEVCVAHRSLAERPASFDGGYLENPRTAIGLEAAMIRRDSARVVHGVLPSLQKSIGLIAVISLRDTIFRRPAECALTRRSQTACRKNRRKNFARSRSSEPRVDGLLPKRLGPEIAVF